MTTITEEERSQLCWLSGYIESVAEAVQALDSSRAEVLFREAQKLFELARRLKAASHEPPAPEPEPPADGWWEVPKSVGRTRYALTSVHMRGGWAGEFEGSDSSARRRWDDSIIQGRPAYDWSKARRLVYADEVAARIHEFADEPPSALHDYADSLMGGGDSYIAQAKLPEQPDEREPSNTIVNRLAIAAEIRRCAVVEFTDDYTPLEDIRTILGRLADEVAGGDVPRTVRADEHAKLQQECEKLQAQLTCTRGGWVRADEVAERLRDIDVTGAEVVEDEDGDCITYELVRLGDVLAIADELAPKEPTPFACPETGRFCDQACKTSCAKTGEELEPTP